MYVVATCDATNRMSKDFDCRFRNILIVVTEEYSVDVWQLAILSLRRILHCTGKVTFGIRKLN